MEEDLEYLLSFMTAAGSLGVEGIRVQVWNPVPRFTELNPDFPARVQKQWADLLESRSMTTRDYCYLNEVQFADEDSLYDFLSRVYRYVFEDEGLDDPPRPFPDQDDEDAIF